MVLTKNNLKTLEAEIENFRTYGVLFNFECHDAQMREHTPCRTMHTRVVAHVVHDALRICLHAHLATYTTWMTHMPERRYMYVYTYMYVDM